MTALFIAAVVLALWVLYDSGQGATERIRMQNTADNVAYSSAALVSRDLNFIAYTNRAMVANQVAIGQVVGLSSWVAMVNQFGHNVDMIGDMLQWFVPYGPIIKGITAEIEAVTVEIADIADAFAGIAIPVSEFVLDRLSEVQFIYHHATLLALADFGDHVARMNDPDVDAVGDIAGFTILAPASFYQEWAGLIGDQNALHRVSDESESAQLELQRYREFEQITGESRDRFTAARSYRWPGLPVHPWGGEIPLTVRWRSPKYGGTDLVREVGDDDRYRWSWAGMDTVSIWFSHYECGADIPPCKWSGYDEYLPLAWGAAHALPDDADDDYFEYGGSRRDSWRWGDGAWRNEIGAGFVAESATMGAVDAGGYNPFLNHAEHKVADIGGLREFYELRQDGAIDEGPSVIAFYRKRAAKISSQRTIINGAGGAVAADLDTETYGALADDGISAIAKAQPYFARPTDLDGWKRRDGLYEHGNLYSPYWQPRLIDLSDVEKGLATAAAGIGAP